MPFCIVNVTADRKRTDVIDDEALYSIRLIGRRSIRCHKKEHAECNHSNSNYSDGRATDMVVL